MRKVIMVILAVFCLAQSTPAGEKPTMGLTFPSLRNEWYSFLDFAVKKKAKELNADVVSLEANNEVSRQISVVEDLITHQVDGILIVPIETKAVVPAVEAANEAGIPVVTVDRNLDKDASVDIIGHVGADNYAGGRNAGLYMVEQLMKKNGSPKGTVIELYGIVGAGTSIARSSGFMDVLKQYPEIQVHTQTASFMRSDAMKVMEDYILSIPNIDGVFATNDDMILGAVEAIDASGKFKPEDLILVGFDAMPDALKAVRDGVIDATIEQHPIKQVSMGFEILYNYVTKGEKPAESIIFLEPIVITRENIDLAEDKSM